MPPPLPLPLPLPLDGGKVNEEAEEEKRGEKKVSYTWGNLRRILPGGAEKRRTQRNPRRKRKGGAATGDPPRFLAPRDLVPAPPPRGDQNPSLPLVPGGPPRPRGSGGGASHTNPSPGGRGGRRGGGGRAPRYIPGTSLVGAAARAGGEGNPRGTPARRPSLGDRDVGEVLE